MASHSLLISSGRHAISGAGTTENAGKARKSEKRAGAPPEITWRPPEIRRPQADTWKSAEKRKKPGVRAGLEKRGWTPVHRVTPRKQGVRFGLSQPRYFQRPPCYFRGRSDRKRRKSEEKRETRGRPSGNNMATAGNNEATGGHLEKCEKARNARACRPCPQAFPSNFLPTSTWVGPRPGPKIVLGVT